MNTPAMHPMDKVEIPMSAKQLPAIIPIRFWVEYKEGPNGEIIEEDWVEWVKKGEQNGSTTSESVARLMPSKARNRPRGSIEWYVIEPAYSAWKANDEIPVDGTSLTSWSGVSRELVEQLKKFSIFTIEDLASFPDHNVSKIPLPGFRDVIRRAKAYVEAKDVSDMGATLASKDKTIETMGQQLAAMEDKIRELQADTAQKGVLVGKATQALREISPDDEFVEIGPNDVPATKAPSKKKN